MIEKLATIDTKPQNEIGGSLSDVSNNKLDTSKPIDFSRPDEVGGKLDNSKLDTSREQDYSNDAERKEYNLYTSHTDRLNQTPKDSEKGTWKGEREESEFVPNDIAENKRAAIESKVPNINGALAGKVHPEANVPFVKKTIEIDGQKIERAFPKFEPKFEATLQPELFKAPDGVQFAECNKQLLEKLNKSSTLANKFNDVQLDQIKNLDTPDGFVWHHNEKEGLMQLVDALPHRKAGHVGGRCIWGGGAAYR